MVYLQIFINLQVFIECLVIIKFPVEDTIGSVFMNDFSFLFAFSNLSVRVKYFSKIGVPWYFIFIGKS